jgi:hypothetical protein
MSGSKPKHRTAPHGWTQVLAFAALAFTFGNHAEAQPPTTRPAPSVESTTPIETVPVLPPAKPTLPYPERNTVSAKHVKDFMPIRGNVDDENEYATYNGLLLHARNFTADELLAAGRKDVSYSDLLAKDDDHREPYRYEIIRFDGRLTRLKKFPPTPELAAQGVTDLYEAWIYPSKDNKPVCVVLLEPPAGVEPNLEIIPNRSISVAGYFFKVLAFTSGEKATKEGNTVTRFAPVIFAKGMQVAPLSESDAGNIWRTSFLPAVFTTIGLLTVFVLGLTWYFRRGDRASKKAVEAKKQNPFNADPAQQNIAPVDPGDWDSLSSDRR